MDLAARLGPSDIHRLMESLVRVLVWILILGVGVVSPSSSVGEIEPEAERIFEAYADFLGGEEAFEKIESGRMRNSAAMINDTTTKPITLVTSSILELLSVPSRK